MLLWAGRTLFVALSATPGPRFGHGAAATALALRYQEGLKPGLADAWDTLDRAIAVMKESEQAFVVPEGQPRGDYVALAEPEGLEYLPRELHRPVLERTRAIVNRFETDGGAAALLDLPATERALRSLRPEVQAFHDDRRSDLRRLARLCVGRMAVAGWKGDGAACVRALEQGLAIGRILMQQPDRTDQLSGSAIVQLMLWQARRTLMLPERPLRNHCLAMARAVERQHRLMPSASFLIETQRLETIDYIQRAYSDNGRGNGRVIVSSAIIYGAPPPLSGGVGKWILKQLDGYQILNLFSAAYPDKRSALAKADEYADRLLKLAEIPRWSRREEMESFEAWADAISPKHFLIYKDKSVHSWFTHCWLLDHQASLEAHFAGVRTFIAIEQHVSRTMSVPESLGDLVPATLVELPLDPYSGEPMQYVPLSERPWYTLYSVGWDETDNQAAQHPDGLDGVFASHGVGYDFVFNIPPPKQEP